MWHLASDAATSTGLIILVIGAAVWAVLVPL